MTTPDRPAPESCGCSHYFDPLTYYGRFTDAACLYPETVEALAKAKAILRAVIEEHEKAGAVIPAVYMPEEHALEAAREFLYDATEKAK
jgi:hypothetical protein